MGHVARASTFPVAERLIIDTIQTVIRFLAENPQAIVLVKVYTRENIRAFLKPFSGMEHVRYQAVVRFPWDVEDINSITNSYGLKFHDQKAFGGGRKYMLEVRRQDFIRA